VHGVGALNVVDVCFRWVRNGSCFGEFRWGRGKDRCGIYFVAGAVLDFIVAGDFALGVVCLGASRWASFYRGSCCGLLMGPCWVYVLGSCWGFLLEVFCLGASKGAVFT